MDQWNRIEPRKEPMYIRSINLGQKLVLHSPPLIGFKDTPPFSGSLPFPMKGYLETRILKYPSILWSLWISELKQWATSVCIS